MMTTDAEAPSPFHEGEQRIQSALGVRDIEMWARRVVRDHLPEQHRAFHTSLPFLVAAARDDAGRPWATLLVGPPGFVESPHDRALTIRPEPLVGDMLGRAWRPGADVGLLGIELSTRRRNRVNGRIASEDDGVMVFAVDQTFGNCPQHIGERDVRRVARSAGLARRSRALTPAQIAWIAGADTLFLASGYRGAGDRPSFGMDASHRGGDPGFVRATSATEIRMLDYAGNNHFNTLGNLLLDARVGLSFIDFEEGSLLQITGRASIDLQPSPEERARGAAQVLVVAVEEVNEMPESVPLAFSPRADAVRTVRVVEKVRESEDIVSFLLESADRAPLPPFVPGQYLPLRIDVDGETVRRTYSLSGAPDGPRRRISVRRIPGGLASSHLHDRVDVGDEIRVERPRGEFILDPGQSPVVLVSAGVGVTPLLSMLHGIVRRNEPRSTWFIHGARDGRHHAFATEVRELAAKHPAVRTHVRFSAPGPDDRGHDSVGRIDAELLSSLDLPLDGDYFVCGPAAFMAEVIAALGRLGLPEERIFVESFGG